MSRHPHTEAERSRYPLRVALSLAASLLLAILVVQFWPIDTDDGPPDGIYDTRARELVQLEEIQPTKQQQRRPPPPRPMIPIVVPDDFVLETEEIEIFDSLEMADPGDEDGEEDLADATSQGASARPDSGPRVVRFVQPEYTREAQRRDVRAEVVVEVLVSARGQVTETRVVERFLIGKSPDDREAVAALGYGLEEAALAAARQCMFRAARVDGQRATAYTTLTFTFGI